MLPGTSITKELSGQEEAEQWFRDHPSDWDLALVDLFLATGNGFQVLKCCAQRSEDQKVVVVTNYSTSFVRGHVRSFGADAFFDKIQELDLLANYCKSAAKAAA